jgi:hypothetical protein
MPFAHLDHNNHDPLPTWKGSISDQTFLWIAAHKILQVHHEI